MKKTMVVDGDRKGRLIRYQGRWVSDVWWDRYVWNGFNEKWHVRNNSSVPARDKVNPCKVCGWSQHMAIHDEGNRTVRGYGHAFEPGVETPTVSCQRVVKAVKSTKREREMAHLKVNLDQLVKEGKLTRNAQGLYGLPEWETEKKPVHETGS